MGDRFGEIRRLIRLRRFDEALAQSVGADADEEGEAETLRLRRQCLARLGRFDEAAAAGERLLRRGDGNVEDAFRQAQVAAAAGRPREALKAGLEALRPAPGDHRLIAPLARAVLLEPGLYDDLAAALAGMPGAEAAAVSLPSRPSRPDRVFVPLRAPYYRGHDGAHPGTMGMIERCAGVDVWAPDAMGQNLAGFLPALRHAMTLVEPLTAIHRLVDRAAAAAWLADRLPCLMIDDGGAALDFISNAPVTLGVRPWVLWCDVPGSLFQPFQYFEDTQVAAADSPWFWIVRAFLTSERCLRVVTHYRTDDNPLTALYPEVADKLVFFHPYSPHAAESGPGAPDEGEGGNGAAGRRPRRLLFTSSFNAREEDFYYRGGVDALTAFLRLADRFDDIELVMRAAVPSTLGPGLRARVLNHPRIRWCGDFMPAAEYRALMASCDFFISPSVVLYRNGLVEAMRLGQTPVTSDVWGAAELVPPGTGIITPGRRRLTVLDRTTACLRHDWRLLLQAVEEPADPAFCAALTDAVAGLLADPPAAARRAAACRAFARSLPVGDFDGFGRMMRGRLAEAATVATAPPFAV